PFYCKPSLGGYGSANYQVVKLDRASDRLTLANGEEYPVAEFCARLGSGRGLGWVLQEVLHPHAAIRELCGDRVCGIRFNILLRRSGPSIFRAVWKIATGTNPFDNYHKGREGNMIASIDVGTGRLVNFVGGLVPFQEERSVHPDTRRDLRGFVLPEW